MGPLLASAENRKYMAVLDFRHASDHREYRGPKGYLWLMVLILLLGVAVILADRARQPGAWRWLDRLAETSQGVPAEGIDNRLDSVSRNDSPPDSFIIPKQGPRAEKPEGRKGYFPGVNPALLDSIRDDTIFSGGDRECSLNLLDVLNKTDQKKLREASEGRVTYAQLFRQPAHYRGRLVTVSGVVRRVERLDLPENKYGIGHYFEVLLYPNIKPPSPIVIYCLRLPRGFPAGMEVSEEAEVTGFFFKRWVYPAKDALRSAPTIMAKTLHWRKGPEIPKEPTVEARKLIPAVLCAALLAIITAWYVYMRTTPSRPALSDRPPDFELLKERDQRSETADQR